jgi:hypothetical protein
MKKTILLVAILGFLTPHLFCQINMTASGSHTQDFNTMAIAGSTNAWANNSTIANWYSQRTGTGTTYAADAGGATAGNLYSYGASSAADRAIGALGSSNVAAGSFAHGVLLQNTSGTTITSITVTYSGEQWRSAGAVTANVVGFYYKTSSSSITALTPNVNTTWTAVPALNFSSPINTGAAAALNGNLAANRVVVAATPIPSLSLANNDYIMLKWEDPDHTGSDHGLSIDDVTITWTVASSSPPTITTPLAAISGTYGTAISNYTIPTTNSPTSFSVTGLPTGLSLSNAGVLSGTPTQAGTFVASIIAFNSAGASPSANLNITISPINLSISGLTANSKIFDGLTTAILSGTPVLNGVLAVDIGNVTLGGTTVANFASPAIGVAIPVAVSGYTITGSASGNYSLSQPSGLTADINAAPIPVITSALTSSGTYGTLFGGYLITATKGPTSFSATNLPKGLSVDPLTGDITGTPIVVGTISSTVSATNAGGTGSATLVFTIGRLAISVSGASASNKLYNNSINAIITGTLSGVYGTDTVDLVGTGTFASVNVGSAIAVTSTSTLTGVDTFKYTLIQPTGLSADITPGNQTINFTLTPSVTIATATINMNASATSTLPITYASSNTAVATVSGSILTIVGLGTTTITASQSGNSNYNAAVDVTQVLNVIPAPTLTEIILPQYIQGVTGSNTNRLPYAFRVKLDNLIANATYRYNVGFDTCLNSNPLNFGAGIGLFPGASASASFTLAATQGLSSVGQYGTFTASATGSYTGWFAGVPSANASRFVPGNSLVAKIVLNNGSNGTTSSTALKTNSTIKVINLTTGSTLNDGTGFYGNSNATAKNFVFVYDNISGTGRPIAGTVVEDDGALATSYASFYTTNVNANAGAYGLIIPNQNTNGIRRIEQRSFINGSLAGCPSTDADGIWPSGTNTVNPSGGTTAISVTTTDASLTTGVLSLSTSPQVIMTQQCIDPSGWSLYGDGTGLYFAIDKSGATGLMNDTVSITIDTLFYKVSTSSTNKENGSYLMKRFWDVKSSAFTGSVKIRFFYDPSDSLDVIIKRDLDSTTIKTANSASLITNTPFEWFKTVGTPFNDAWRASIVGNKFPTTHLKLTPAAYGILNGVSYVQFDNITSFSGGTGGAGFGAPSGGAAIGLPVTWAEFKVETTESGYALKWKTASEQNTSHFEVEYSYDGSKFIVANQKIQAAGNSANLKTYNFIHSDFTSIVYYRIKQIDIDNRFSYSEIKTARRTYVSSPIVSIYPVPLKVDNILKLKLSAIDQSEVNLKLINLTGKVVYTNSIFPKSDTLNETIDLSDLPSGIYFLEIKNGQFKTMKKVFK